MVIKRSMYYPPAGSSRTLHIYLPDDYYSSDERYPVMYFFDGHNLFFDHDATYGKCWGIKDYLDAWDKKVIIVGMECSHEGHARLSEYNPYPVPEGHFPGGTALGDATVRWIIDDIKPFIDSDYRTWSHREATAIGGSSMGGIMALYAVVKYNAVFSKAACISSAIGYCTPQLMKDMNTCSIVPDTRAFLSWGTKEAQGLEDPSREDFSSYTYRRNKAAADKFLEHGAISALHCQVGGGHCEADWEKLVPDFMNFLWK